ncbi:hypothetical protein [Streptomyces sp. NPDC059446]|uniref:hypothetical protein n=1 Tax=Streptomyces sp. NPDC059446 TaxID=3346833 RepID=UPI00367FF6CC
MLVAEHGDPSDEPVTVGLHLVEELPVHDIGSGLGSVDEAWKSLSDQPHRQP